MTNEFTKKVIADFGRRLSQEEFEALKNDALHYIHNKIENSKEWRRCYSLKQKFTREVSYCFQADFYEYLKICGFEVNIDDRGDHWAKATYCKN